MSITKTKAVVAKDYDDNPIQTMNLEELDLPKVEKASALVKVMAASVHLIDIIKARGKFGTIKFPYVPGIESVGQVVQVGEDVKNVQPGDNVVIRTFDGAYQTHAVVDAAKLFKIPSSIDPVIATQMKSLPLTAYLLVTTQTSLRAGQVVIQDGATSGVAIYLMQLCKLLGIKTINIFRPRGTTEGNEKVKQVLKDFGATYSLTTDELDDFITNYKSDVVGKVKLGVTFSGGDVVSKFAKILDNEGVITSYGDRMGDDPIKISPGQFMMKSLKFVGFNFGKYLSATDVTEFKGAIEYISGLFASGQMKPSPYKVYEFDNWRQALDDAYGTKSNREDVARKSVIRISK